MKFVDLYNQCVRHINKNYNYDLAMSEYILLNGDYVIENLLVILRIVKKTEGNKNWIEYEFRSGCYSCVSRYQLEEEDYYRKQNETRN